ncbi:MULTISPECIES: MFS transporter [Streptomyces]|uniref:MFS transporter n=1 Tax=Streptomyces venezuelae TaxID=54571 RepID=A0A5P2ALK7_STRVZ|nr:MFS transporter [Streptomyces venezuelae]QES19124.1 MFS transporter [Streptomyces venezuelae]
MLSVLRNRTYRRLFTAQVVALAGTGLATVALSLLAYDLAGANASAVLGTALAIKMAAYVGMGPVVGALAGRLPRRTLLVTLDLVRAGVAVSLPFVTQVWQIYVLILLLQTASAAFTPTFQATIPEVLPEERDYTRALSLSRLAYDLESLLSPALAAALLTLVPYDRLFTGTAAGFLLSGVLVRATALPAPAPAARGGGLRARAAFGTRLLLGTPRLRALLALDLAVAAAGATVFVNTVVLVRDTLGRASGDVPLALGVYGAGSMTVALLLPRALDRRPAEPARGRATALWPAHAIRRASVLRRVRVLRSARVLRPAGERTLMLRAAFVLAGGLGLLALGLASTPGGWTWSGLLVVWAVLGAATSAILTPGGRLLRRSARSADLPAVFAARFSLSHAGWLLTYPLAGWLAARAGLAASAAVLTGVALIGALTAARLWPRTDPAALEHAHPELPAGHPHLVAAGGGGRHAHDFHIDELHRRWPRREVAS